MFNIPLIVPTTRNAYDLDLFISFFLYIYLFSFLEQSVDIIDFLHVMHFFTHVAFFFYKKIINKFLGNLVF